MWKNKLVGQHKPGKGRKQLREEPKKGEVPADNVVVRKCHVYSLGKGRNVAIRPRERETMSRRSEILELRQDERKLWRQPLCLW